MLIEKRRVRWKTSQKAIAEDESKDGGGLNQNGGRDDKAGVGRNMDLRKILEIKYKGLADRLNEGEKER